MSTNEWEMELSAMTAEELLQKLDYFGYDSYYKAFREPLIKEIRKRLRRREVKHGKWIDYGFYADGHPHHAYACPECDENYIGFIGEFNYCPNCGADMRPHEEIHYISVPEWLEGEVEE